MIEERVYRDYTAEELAGDDGPGWPVPRGTDDYMVVLERWDGPYRFGNETVAVCCFKHRLHALKALYGETLEAARGLLSPDAFSQHEALRDFVLQDILGQRSDLGHSAIAVAFKTEYGGAIVRCSGYWDDFVPRALKWFHKELDFEDVSAEPEIAAAMTLISRLRTCEEIRSPEFVQGFRAACEAYNSCMPWMSSTRRVAMIHAPVEEGDVGEVRRVLSKAPSFLNLREPTLGATPLMRAVCNGDVEMVRLLAEMVADVNLPSLSGTTPLHDVATHGGAEIAAILLAHGADVLAKDDTAGCTPLHYAANNGHMDIVEQLIARGADVNARDRQFGSTPLHRAVMGGRSEIVDFMLAHGAEVNTRSNDGWTPLHAAVMLNSTGMIDLLIHSNANVNAADSANGGTPLHWAVEGDFGECVTTLLAAGADTELRDRSGMTPLHVAARTDKTQAAMALIEGGADLSARTRNGLTPLFLSVMHNQLAVCALLQRYGARS